MYSSMTSKPSSHFDLLPNWLNINEADELLQTLEYLSWRQDQLTLFGKTHPIPRQHLWFSQYNDTYRYSGIELSSAGWPEWLRRLQIKLQHVHQITFNSVLANHYRNGQDKMGWHCDDEPELGENPTIAILSVGAPRFLGIRQKNQTKMLHKYLLTHGSLLLMRPGAQQHWQHALLAQSKRQVPNQRFSLTFRQIKVTSS